MSCLNSIQAIRKAVNFFNKHGNTVNLAAIDIRRAFDKSNVFGILEILQHKNVNPHIVRILSQWLSNQVIKVKWNVLGNGLLGYVHA